MREKLKRWLLFIMVLSLLMSMSAAPAEVHAASKVTETVLNKKKVTLTVGETVQLKLKNAPKDKAVTWSSSKKSVATVKKGKVKAKKAGTAKVTAKVNNKSYSCTVTVKKFALSNTKGKNASDVKILQAIIQEQNAQGATLSTDLNDMQYYGWDEKGNLTELDCEDCGLKGSLSLKGLASLIYLNCSYNELSSLDVSTCKELCELKCSGNQLSSLNVSACAALIGLNCSGNQLSSLDVSACTTLNGFICSYNELSSLDVSAFKELSILDCSGNQLSTLDVSACTALIMLGCADNRLNTLDLSKNVELIFLNCADNQLSTLDLSKNVALTFLDCSGNQLSTLDLSTCTDLWDWKCDENVTVIGYSAD